MLQRYLVIDVVTGERLWYDSMYEAVLNADLFNELAHDTNRWIALERIGPDIPWIVQLFAKAEHWLVKKLRAAQ